MYIKNATKLLRKELSKDQLQLRELALHALEKSIQAVRPQKLIENAIKIQGYRLYIQNDVFDLRKFKRIFIIGGGKATAEMGFTLENMISNASNISCSGIINVPKGTVNSDKLRRSKIKINYAAHPVPDEEGLKGTKLMIEIVENSNKDDLILCLISGGGSALLPLPQSEINLKDLQVVNSLLLASGASIHEINSIRKHLSDFKGGNLAKKVYNASKATLITLIISDVVGNKLDSIASGPTVPDTSTFQDAVEVLKRYNIYNKVPTSVVLHLEKGLRDNRLETPKINDACFNNVYNYLVGSVKFAVEAVMSFLELEGFKVIYFSDGIIGEAAKFGESLFDIIRQSIMENLSNKLALIGSGELTVTIKGKGIGGRNQEMLLGFLDSIRKKEISYEFVMIGANLDGIEGNSNAMGALIDNVILDQIRKEDINIRSYLENNNSNSLFRILETDIVTNPTGCNVNDLLLVLVRI